MNNNKLKWVPLTGTMVALLGTVSAPLAQAAVDAEAVIQQKCLACHTATGNPDAPYSRISQLRKTPEGWMMTLNRMQHRHGLKVSPEEVRALVAYLSDRQGLAPSETASMRYVLEQKPNVMETIDPAYVEMCARCHSAARFGLQRRTQEEWGQLVNTHMALHPSLELHALSRDRPWYELALNETVPKLAADYPLDTAAWKQWQQAAKPNLAGRWSVIGYLPGKGDYSALLQATARSGGGFDLTLEGHYADGSALHGSGSAKLFSGYEWRATLTLDGVPMRQVLAAAEDGSTLSGRMFERAHDEIGGEFKAVSGAAIAGIFPQAIQQGATQQLTIVGAGLNGTVSLGTGVTVKQVLSRQSDRVVVLAEASANAQPGLRSVSVGGQQAATPLAVYDRVAGVQVVPSESIARVGGNGGKLPKVQAHYRAQGFAAGPDGQAGTEDDLALGYLPARWALAAFDEVAEADQDLKYAGSIDANGLFTPGDAGLNPARKMSTNNVGNLKVVAQVGDGGEAVSGEAHLLVTVPTFIKRAIQ